MIRTCSTALTKFCLALFCLATPASSQSLRVYNWANYIAPQTLVAFQAETGIEISYHQYQTLEELDPLASRLTPASGGNEASVDILILPAWRAETLAGAGRVALLAQNRLSRFAALDPLLVQHLPKAPAGGVFAVPYLWGTAGLAFDKHKIGQKTGDVFGWDALFAPQEAARNAQCGIGLAAEGVDFLAGVALFEKLGGAGLVLEARGALLEAVEARFLAASPYVKGFFPSFTAAGALAKGELCLAQVRAPDLYRLIQAGAMKSGQFGYLLPVSGAYAFMDVIIVAPGADKEAAYQWLNFLLRAPVAAANAAAAGHGPVVVDAQQFLPAGAADNVLLAPTPEERARLVFFKGGEKVADDLQKRLQIWFEAGKP